MTMTFAEIYPTETCSHIPRPGSSSVYMYMYGRNLRALSPTLLRLLEERAQPARLALHVLRRARLAVLVRVHLERLRMRRGERVLGAVERGVDVVVAREEVRLELAREDVEVHVRHSLAGRRAVLAVRERTDIVSSSVGAARGGLARVGDITHLTGDSQPVGAVRTLDDAPDVLHGGHERRELVLLEVGEAGDDTGGYYEDICGGREAVKTSLRPGSSGRTDGLRLGRWA